MRPKIDLHVAISEGNMLPLLHAQALDMFNACTDLKLVCHTLYSPDLVLEDDQTNLSIFKAFKPMLAKRNQKDFKEIVKLAMAGGMEGFYVDEKLDGERMQMHKRGDQYRYWSR